MEVDCVLVMGNGDYALIEIKLGSDEEDEAASNLLKLKDLICKQKESGEINISEPKFLAIVTGGKMAHVREEG